MADLGNARPRGAVAWMAHNRVTPNLVMMGLLVGGLMFAFTVRQEVFPEISRDVVAISVSYPGASPEEIERGILLAAEEAVRGVDNVKEVRSRAVEGIGTLEVEFEQAADRQEVYQNVRQEVDRITTFPEDAEDPMVSLVSARSSVLSVQIFGDTDERSLRLLGDEVRDALLQEPGITQVELRGARDYEIHVDVPQQALQRHGLTLASIADQIEAMAVEMPGGSVKTDGGEILVRFSERFDTAAQLREMPIISQSGGGELALGEIAEVREGFEDVNRTATYDGRPAVGLDIYQVGDQKPTDLARAGRAAMERIGTGLPDGVEWRVNEDLSKIFSDRFRLLIENGALGLILVVVLLGLFLEMRLAFWIALGIPVSFLGAFLFLPGMDVSLNMISMFAFMIALGIVVDDAVVVGENVYAFRAGGSDGLTSAVRGTGKVFTEVTFSVLTNVAAFAPLLFLGGMMGKIWKCIPLVVMAVFAISWFESLFILPAHLAHLGGRPKGKLWGALHDRQQRFSRSMEAIIGRFYAPVLAFALRRRYLVIATAVFLLLAVMAIPLSGRMGLTLMPAVESDYSEVTAVLPLGTPVERMKAVRDRIETAARTVVDRHGGAAMADGIYSLIDENTLVTKVYLVAPEVRPISTAAFTREWREVAGTIPGLERIQFAADAGGPTAGPALTVRLSHRDSAQLNAAAGRLGQSLAVYGGVFDVDDGVNPGKAQMDFRLNAYGRSLGLTTASIARQARNAFFGAEPIAQQRGRNEVTVRVRRAETERVRAKDIETLLVRTPDGGDVPLMEVADVVRGRAYTAIDRVDGARVLDVTANVEPVEQAALVEQALMRDTVPNLVAEYPGLTVGKGGQQADIAESMSELAQAFLVCVLVIYLLLAIPFRSYTQPMIVMIAVPFGLVGAVLGHLVMGYGLSVVSVMGIVALTGVVINDSLVMVSVANDYRAEGKTAHEAMAMAGARRLRPILLTTLTTFGGLAPMIFETSRQARFMIPMALSLGVGLLFATAITLLLIPALYLALEDVTGRWVRTR